MMMHNYFYKEIVRILHLKSLLFPTVLFHIPLALIYIILYLSL